MYFNFSNLKMLRRSYRLVKKDNYKRMPRRGYPLNKEQSNR